MHIISKRKNGNEKNTPKFVNAQFYYSQTHVLQSAFVLKSVRKSAFLHTSFLHTSFLQAVLKISSAFPHHCFINSLISSYFTLYE